MRAALEVQGGHVGRALSRLKHGRWAKLGDGTQSTSAEQQQHQREFARCAASAASSTASGSTTAPASGEAATTAAAAPDDDAAATAAATAAAARYRLSFEGGAAPDGTGTLLLRVGPSALTGERLGPLSLARAREVSLPPSSPPAQPSASASPVYTPPYRVAAPSPSDVTLPTADAPGLWYWSRLHVRNEAHLAWQSIGWWVENGSLGCPGPVSVTTFATDVSELSATPPFTCARRAGTGLFPKTRTTWDPAYGRRRRPSPPREPGARTLYSPLPPFFPACLPSPSRGGGSRGSSAGEGESFVALPRAGAGEVSPSSPRRPTYSRESVNGSVIARRQALVERISASIPLSAWSA